MVKQGDRLKVKRILCTLRIDSLGLGTSVASEYSRAFPGVAVCQIDFLGRGSGLAWEISTSA